MSCNCWWVSWGDRVALNDISSSLSLLQLELSSSELQLTVVAFCFVKVFGKDPGTLVVAFSAFIADSLRIFRASSHSSSLAASLISHYLIDCATSRFAFSLRDLSDDLDSSFQETSLPALVINGSMLLFSLTR